jgi:hypothetical protein
MSKHVTTTTEQQSTFTVQQSALAESEETRVFKKLQPILVEIRKNPNLIGFTMKNSTQAIVDVNKPEELAQLSLLASQLFESSRKLLTACNQRSMKRAVLEGSKMRILCLSIDGNQLSIFMEKTLDCDRIVEQLARAGI